LLAEDVRVNQKLISRLLEKAGLTVDVPPNGRIAVETIEAGGEYDLVLMDIQMPEVDGLEATKILRERGHVGPIVALTAHAMGGYCDRCLEAGCDDYLTKPVDRTRLLEVIDRRLGPDERSSAPGAATGGDLLSLRQ